LGGVRTYYEKMRCKMGGKVTSEKWEGKEAEST